MEDDLNAGLIGREAAEGDYGVVVAAAHPVGNRLRYTLDPAATAARRAGRA